MRTRSHPRNRTAALTLGLLLGFGAGVQAEVVVVVSASNPQPNLSREQIADIFLGRTNRFPDGRIAVPIDHGEGSAVREAFYAEFIGRSEAQIKAHWSKIIFTGRGQPPRQVNSGEEARRFLKDNPSAIGYIDRSELDDSLRPVETPES